MLDKVFKRPLGNAHKGVFHQMIWYCSLLKWICSHALGFSYGDHIRKISTCQNRRKILFCILKTKKKWLSVLKGISDAHIKVDAHPLRMKIAWHGMS